MQAVQAVQYARFMAAVAFCPDGVHSQLPQHNGSTFFSSRLSACRPDRLTVPIKQVSYCRAGDRRTHHVCQAYKQIRRPPPSQKRQERGTYDPSYWIVPSLSSAFVSFWSDVHSLFDFLAANFNRNHTHTHHLTLVALLAPRTLLVHIPYMQLRSSGALKAKEYMLLA